MLLKCCTQYASKFGNLSSGFTGLKKVNFHSNSKKAHPFVVLRAVGHAQCPAFDLLLLLQALQKWKLIFWSLFVSFVHNFAPATHVCCA